MAEYFRPAQLADALGLMRQQRCRPLAGGTDFYPGQSLSTARGEPGLAHPDHPATLDLGGIEALREIREHDDRIELGAMVSWTDAIECSLPTWFDGVRMAAREVGGAQIQNRGTLAGNLCNASPAADGVPALMALNARVRVQNCDASREFAVDEFIDGNRQTKRRTDELVTAVIVPKPEADTRSVFLKLGARSYLVISIAMVAITLRIDGSSLIASAALAVGACSTVAKRLPALERRLLGQRASEATALVEAADFAALEPISDSRASADYRQHAARILVQRGLARLATRQPREQAA